MYIVEHQIKPFPLNLLISEKIIRNIFKTNAKMLKTFCESTRRMKTNLRNLLANKA